MDYTGGSLSDAASRGHQPALRLIEISSSAGRNSRRHSRPPLRRSDRAGAAAARPQDTATTPQLRPPIAVPPPLLPRRSPRRSPRRRAVPPCRRAAAPPLTVAVHNAHHILPPRGSPAYVRPRHERSPHPFPPCGSPAYCVASFGRRRRVHGDEQRTTTPMAAHTTIKWGGLTSSADRPSGLEPC